MSFRIHNPDGTIKETRKVTLECDPEKILTEQSHKDEVNINKIVKRHGIDMLQKVAALQEPQFDDLPNNDFEEAMIAVTKAQQTFDQLPSVTRKFFDNNPALFMDYIHNPENQDNLVDMGLATHKPIDEPVQVIVTNSEAPPAQKPVAE